MSSHYASSDSRTPTPPETDPQAEYFRLAYLCCNAIRQDSDEERRTIGGSTFDEFLDGCKRRLHKYPTLRDLRAHIASNPKTENYAPDLEPHLDEALRLMSGLDTNGVQDFVAAQKKLHMITQIGRTVEQRCRGSVLATPPRDLCGRGNALEAYIFQVWAATEHFREIAASHLAALFPRGHSPSVWNLFLRATIHAADAARQRFVSNSVLSVGYSFRHLANLLSVNLCSDLYLSPLLLALREHMGCEMSKLNHIPQGLFLTSDMPNRLRIWVREAYEEWEKCPNPYWDGRPERPLPMTQWRGVLND